MMLHCFRSKRSIAIRTHLKYILVPVLKGVFIVHLNGSERIFEWSAIDAKSANKASTGIRHKPLINVFTIFLTIDRHHVIWHLVIWMWFLPLRNPDHILKAFGWLWNWSTFVFW